MLGAVSAPEVQSISWSNTIIWRRENELNTTLQ